MCYYYYPGKISTTGERERARELFATLPRLPPSFCCCYCPSHWKWLPQIQGLFPFPTTLSLSLSLISRWIGWGCVDKTTTAAAAASGSAGKQKEEATLLTLNQSAKVLLLCSAVLSSRSIIIVGSCSSNNNCKVCVLSFREWARERVGKDWSSSD